MAKGSKNNTPHGVKPTPLSLSVIIIGGGIAGLATAYCLGSSGHHVTVLEKASELKEAGAGIQMTPKVSRLLERWGLKEKLNEKSVIPKMINFYQYDTGKTLGFQYLNPNMKEKFGAPHYSIHRNDLLQILLDLAAPYMTLHLSSKVVSLNPTLGSVTLASGRTMFSDLIISADGIQSPTRSIVLGEPSSVSSIGVAVYRGTLKTDLMLEFEELKGLLDPPQQHLWMGPDHHIVGYSMNEGKEFNLAMSYPDPNPEELWTLEGDLVEMRREFKGWEPRLQKLLSMLTRCQVNKIATCAPAKRWYHPDCKVVLVGDACHPMPPFAAQGAAMAIEDASTLALLLSPARLSRSQLPVLLQAYQAIRAPRIDWTLRLIKTNGSLFHLEKERTMIKKIMAKSLLTGEAVQLNDKNEEEYAPLWIDKKKDEELFGYDTERAVQEWFEKKERAKL